MNDSSLISPYPTLAAIPNSLILINAIKSVNDFVDLEELSRCAVVLADCIAAPPTVDSDLFWDSITASLTASDALDEAGAEYSNVLHCLMKKVTDLLTAQVFVRPEEVTLKQCIEKIGTKVTSMASSRKYCYDMLMKILSSICVVAKFERKSPSEYFAKNTCVLMSSILEQNFSKPYEDSIGKIISEALEQTMEEFSYLMPLVILTSVVEMTVSDKTITGIISPTVEFVCKQIFPVEKRQVLDNLCWKIFLTIISEERTSLSDKSVREKFMQTSLVFLESQRFSAIEANLVQMFPFWISKRAEESIHVVLKKFSGNQLVTVLDILFKNIDSENREWISAILQKWLKSSFYLTSPGFNVVWEFLLDSCFVDEKCNADILWSLSYFLSGFQAFGNQEAVLTSVRENFTELCRKSVKLLNSETFLAKATSDTATMIPALCSVVKIAQLVAVGEIEFSGLEKSAKSSRKLLKKMLRALDQSECTSAHKSIVFEALITLHNLNPSEVEAIEKIKLFLENEDFENFDLNAALKFVLQHPAEFSSNNLLLKLFDEWLKNENDKSGHQLLISLTFLNKENYLSTSLSSFESSNVLSEGIVSMLSSPKCLPMLSSNLAQKVKRQLLDFTLNHLEKMKNVRHSSCGINLVECLIKSENSLSFFEETNVSKFLKMLEYHCECNREVASRLTKLTCSIVSRDDKLFDKVIRFMSKRLNRSDASLVVCQCLSYCLQKLRVVRYKEKFQSMLSKLREDEFSLSHENLASILSDKNCWYLLAVCFIALFDWPKFGRNKVSLESIEALSKYAILLDEFERSLWSKPLIDLLSKNLKESASYDELKITADVLLSDVFGTLDSKSPSFQTTWQTLFKSAGKEAGNLLKLILYIYADDLTECKQKKLSPLCTGYLKALLSSCNNTEHVEEDHFEAVWDDGSRQSPCVASLMARALYDSVLENPAVGVHCLPFVSHFGFFNTNSNGLLSFDMLLGITVSAARASKLLAQSLEHYTAYCLLMASLVRLRPTQNQSEVKLGSILHILIFCLSVAFTTLLDSSLPEHSVGLFFQELGKLIGVTSHRHRLLKDSAIHIVANTLVAAVRAPSPAGYAGLEPVYRKQLITEIVQLFHMCSERTLKSIAVFLPPECLPLLKSVQSESFVQRKARKKA